MDEVDLSELKKQFKNYYGFKYVVFKNLNTAVNDILIATTPNEKFALKLYNTASATATGIQWEVDLINHLLKNGAPVVKPVEGKNSYIELFTVNGEDRFGVLYEWAPGEKPKPELTTYALLGKAAAQIHLAANSFNSTIIREKYDINILIDDQLQRMKNHFIEANLWDQIFNLAERLKKLIANPALDKGVCHMDLTLDNIHIKNNEITVFDFDSAGECWRANEPHAMLKFSREYFQAWLDGYRTIRSFSKEDEIATSAFVIIGNLRVVAWNLGVAKSSRGKPLLTSNDLPKVLDESTPTNLRYLSVVIRIKVSI